MKNGAWNIAVRQTHVLLAGTFLAWGQAAVSQPGQPADAAKRCGALANLPSESVVVEKVELIAHGPAAGPPNATPAMLPEHCLVQGVINRRTGHGGRSFGIGFELRMPIDWNGRFLFQGGAGLDGVLQPAIGNVANSARGPALARGFAVASTDAGHRGSPIDASFGVDQQARIDYAYNALDKVTIEAKRLIAQFYGKTQRYSYMLGCSNGGRQAMVIAQRLPLHFDGIVAGNPTIRFSGVALDELWNVQVLTKIAPKDAQGRPILARAFSDADLKLVKSAVLGRCDARDGLADGMINDWQRCDFDPGVLSCKAGKTESCLSAPQVDALREVHRGPRTTDGKALYGPFNYDTGIASSAWRGMRLGNSDQTPLGSADATLGVGQLKYYQLTPPEPDFDPLAPVDYAQLAERVRPTAALGDGADPFINSFAARGKMILYNGLSDQGLASSELVRWYEQALAVNGPPVRDALRLYLVPGMLHCGGGDATDQFEMLDAITAWVEEGKAPERVLATSRQTPAMTRPLCPFPTVARYKEGDPNSADSFTCSK
jgi:hypothetical protein